MKRLKRKRYQQNRKNKWFDNKNNTYIYITGLPCDITQQELQKYFLKCGSLKIDPQTGEDSIKIYCDADTGKPKGDARIGFSKIESVETAISMLNKTFIRPENLIEVTQAVFEQKGEEFKGRKMQKTDRVTQLMIKSKQEAKLQVGFYEDNSSDENIGIEDLKDTGPKIIIIQNLFTHLEVQDQDDQFFADLEREVKHKIEAELAEVFHLVPHQSQIIKKLEIFRQNPKGVAKIKLKTSRYAEKCISMMDQRWFDKR